MLWYENSQPNFMKREIEAGEKSILPRSAVQASDSPRVRKWGAVASTRSTRLIFLGNIFTVSQPALAPEISSQNTYTGKPPMLPLGPPLSFLPMLGIPLGTGCQRDTGLPALGGEDREETLYEGNLFKLCMVAGPNGASLGSDGISTRVLAGPC